jgi:hypothetical protein
MSQPHEITPEFSGSCKALFAHALGKPFFGSTDSLRRLGPEALRWHNEHAFKG